jgi:hypothetical protein
VAQGHALGVGHAGEVDALVGIGQGGAEGGQALDGVGTGRSLGQVRAQDPGDLVGEVGGRGVGGRRHGRPRSAPAGPVSTAGGTLSAREGRG